MATSNKMRWTVAIGGGILAMAVLIGGAVWGYLAKPPPDDFFRLPTDLKPVHYEVRLQPFLSGNFSVLGHVDIELKALTEAYSITLHVADIDINTGTIRVAPANSTTENGFEILETATDTNLDLFVVHLKQRLLEGESYILSLDFEGHLNDELRGFYRSSYKDEAGDDRMLAATFFAPAHARRAFPCMDEPALKATFSISLAHEDRLHALSNMPLRDSEPVEGQAGWVWDHFETSVPMSTYLVAFVISDFKSKSDGVRFSTWAREAALEQVDYALETGPKALSFFEDYFGIPYPLPKEDMVALPDFAPGAMENWGLITYRETAMLYSPEESSASNKQRVATVVVHELAHQWFGNLVTPTWWTDVWLNEGFASFMEYVGTEHVEPSWQMKEQFVVSELQYVFGIDSLESSHPISVPVVNQDQLGEIYDVIAYVKGSSIIRMMNYYLGEETFRKGISNYLKAFEYAAADQDDLWQFLTQAAHEDDALAPDVTVKDIMDTWTLQTGYPVVKVERDVTGTTALVSQDRFLLLNASDHSDAAPSWWVPLTMTSQDAPDFTRTRPSAWLTPGTSTLILDGLPSADAWVLLNLQQTGYFRVNYDAGNWELLTKQLADAHEVIHVTNRAQVMDDALNLARAGQLPYETALGLTSYLAKEKEYTPWEAAMSSLSYVEKMFTRTAGYGPLRTYLLDLITPLYDDVGFEDDLNGLHLDQYKRVLALSWACHLGHPQCVAESAQQFGEMVLNGTPVSPNLKSTVYCSAIAGGGEEAWESAWALYLEANVGVEKDRLLSAMGCTKEIWLLSRYLEWAFTEGSGIRRQDARTVFRAVANNDVGRYIAWDFLRNRWGTISGYLGGFTTLGNLISYATAEFNTQEELQQLESFYETNLDSLGTATRAIQQAIESTRNNIGWMDANYQAIVTWLEGVAQDV